MNFIVLTIFPEMFKPFWEHGIIKRAIDRNKISSSAINIRDFAEDRHCITDDRPYGGGCGMIMKPEPLAGAIRSALKQAPSSKTILLTPQGRPFNQSVAHGLAACEGVILVCGRYEGVDQRIADNLIDEEVSLGDYVLLGGEVGALAIIEGVTRLLPGVVGNPESIETESFRSGLLEEPQYTRPADYKGWTVPEILLSGDHGKVEEWRQQQRLERTRERRPDLLQKAEAERLERELAETEDLG